MEERSGICRCEGAEEVAVCVRGAKQPEELHQTGAHEQGISSRVLDGCRFMVSTCRDVCIIEGREIHYASVIVLQSPYNSLI